METNTHAADNEQKRTRCRSSEIPTKHNDLTYERKTEKRSKIDNNKRLLESRSEKMITQRKAMTIKKIIA